MMESGFSITGIFGNTLLCGGGNFAVLKREFPVVLLGKQRQFMEKVWYTTLELNAGS